MATNHKKDTSGSPADKRKKYRALLKKLGVTSETGTRHLAGSRRAEAKVALNWLAYNPPKSTKKG